MKIQILGYSGSGKSTFAQELSKIYKIEQTHIDKLYFKDNWIEKDDKEVIESLSKIINKDNWIVDGNYTRLLGNERNELADQIFIFEFNRFRCLINVVKRRIRYNKKVRPSTAPNCIEKLDFQFLKWILKDGRTVKVKNYRNNLKAKYSNKIITFKNHRQVNKYLKAIKVK